MKKKTDLSTQEFHKLIVKLVAAFDTSVEKLREAGAIAVQLVEHDMYSAAYIRKECPSLTKGTFDTLVRIGRGEFLPQLMNASSPGATMLARMHVTEQRRFVEQGEDFPVEVYNTDGTWSTVMVAPLNFTQDQANQCSRVNSAGVRERVFGEEQHAWVIDHRTNVALREARKASKKDKWVVKDGGILVVKTSKEGTWLSVADLSSALNAITNPKPAIDV
jgi:hypothetical protein